MTGSAGFMVGDLRDFFFLAHTSGIFAPMKCLGRKLKAPVNVIINFNYQI